jgi:ABC-2 type transport system permease protein
VAPKEEEEPQNPMMMQQRRRPRGPTLEMAKEKISENYSIKPVDLKDGRVPGDVDVLLLVSPQAFDEKQRFAVDQYLMRGGSVVIASGRYTLDASSMQGLKVKTVDSNLDQMLEGWGIKVAKELVLDPQNEAFPIPVERNVMGLTIQEIQLLKYPFWVDVRGEAMADGNPVTSGLPSITMQWASPIKVTEKKGLEKTVLLKSSKKSWTQDNDNIMPDFSRYPEAGFGHDEKTQTQSYPLAVLATGVFESSFKGKPSPLAIQEQAKDEQAQPSKDKKQKDQGGVIERSPKTARLVVIGSSDFLRDDVLGRARQTGSDRFINNIQFAQNLVDWSVADVDLLTIRSRGTYARTLKPMEEASKLYWEIGNCILVVLAIGAIAGYFYLRRRHLQPISIMKAEQKLAEG